MSTVLPRPPVIVVMGHIDHGKSTLLDYIRKSNVVASEAGGITQHISAYEVEHSVAGAPARRITFLDTPGHEAFSSIRSRGASVVDVTVLMVSAEDGVMPQTLKALKSIKQIGIPFVVAINKIDSPKANVERTKQSLAEKDIMIEEWGGDIPAVALSAKTGQGVDDLLDVVILVADIREMTGDADVPAEGVVIEAHRDGARGISATVIIKDGTLRNGDYVGACGATAPVRLMESFTGKRLTEATFSSPVNIIGWSSIPEVGSLFKSFASKKDAEGYCDSLAKADTSSFDTSAEDGRLVIPLVIKTEVSGTAEAISHEIKKLETERVRFAIVFSGSGVISEADMKRAMSKQGTVVVGFGTSFDPLAAGIRDRLAIPARTFNIIYDLVDWLKEIRDERTPKVRTETVTGALKVLKVFNWNKNQQVLGGRVSEGAVRDGALVRIERRDEILGKGTIKGIQKSKSKADVVHEGDECGLALESRVEVASGDVLAVVEVIES